MTMFVSEQVQITEDFVRLQLDLDLGFLFGGYYYYYYYYFYL